MIILDTNVVSEIFKPQPSERVVAWVEALPSDTAITAVTVAELLGGVRRLPAGRRQAQLLDLIASTLAPYRDTHSILPFDDQAADAYARIVADRESAGRPISTADAQIAGICRSRDAACATRNVKDFELSGIQLLDPWAQ